MHLQMTNTGPSLRGLRRGQERAKWTLVLGSRACYLFSPIPKRKFDMVAAKSTLGTYACNPRPMGVIRGVEKELGLKHFGDFGLPASPSAFSSMGPSHPSFSRSLCEVVARWSRGGGPLSATLPTLAQICAVRPPRLPIGALKFAETTRKPRVRMDLAVVLALRLWHAKDGEFCP